MGADKKFYIGFDLGGTKMLAVVVDENLKILASAKKKTKAELGQDEGLNRVETLIEKVLEKAEVDPKNLGGIGFGLPGVLDLKKGRIVRLLNVGWTDVPMRQRFEKKFGAPVAIDNDVNTGTYGEFKLGAGKGHQDVVGIFPGTGIGGGIIINGRLHHGVTGAAGEIGHVIYNPEGPHCGCGRRGCYETYASRVSISADAAAAVFRGKAPALQEIAGADVANIRSGALAEAIGKGDKVIEEIVRQAAFRIGMLAGIMVVTLSPSLIILGGGLVEAMEKIYLEECRKGLAAHSVPELAKAVSVKAAKLGDDAVVLGGAALALDYANEVNK